MANINNLLDPLNKGRRFTHDTSKNIVFLTYSNEKCEQNAKFLIEQARSLNIFSKIVVETDDISNDKEFINCLKNNKFKSTYNTLKGFGLWLWKPYIIYKNLKKIDDNSVLIYCDPGGKLPINPILKCWAKNKLNEYFLFLDKHNGCMSFESGFLEFFTTKNEIFEFFNNYNIDDDYLTQSRISNLHFIKKTPFSFKVYSEWWNIAKNHSYLFDDCVCRNKKIKGFIEPRNDQSVWSLLCKKYNVVIHKDNPSRRPFKVSTRPISMFRNNQNTHCRWYNDIP